MKILVAIPHYFKDEGSRKYGSLRSDPAPRVAALRATILALHEVAAGPPGLLFPPTRKVVPTNQKTTHRLDVVVCTTGGSHVLDTLDLSSRFYRAHATAAEPMLLGFECHDVLRAGLEDADMFCYLEDDIIIRDPWFFTKLAWFAAWSGPGRLLQPNRYELSAKARVHKLYIDGDIDAKFTAKYQTPPDMPELVTRVMNQALRFRAGPNPHSGCFFLTKAQMRRWAGRDYFLDRDTGFMGPLESAATLGVLRCFEIYKPAPDCASFLEVLHGDNRYLDTRLKFGAGNQFAIAKPT